MATFEIYFADWNKIRQDHPDVDSFFPNFGSEASNLWINRRAEHFEHVANVEAPSVDVVWGLVQHTDRDWRKKEGVAVLVAGELRSSAVGDVYYKPETGETWLVANIGFIEIHGEHV